MNGRQPLRIVVAGGGTGGHLFPGIAVGEAVLDRFPGSEVLFVTTGRQLDSRAVARRRFQTATIRAQGLKGRSLAARVRSLAQLPLGLGESLRLLRRFRPALVLGVGGYVTGPVLLAAWLLRITTCVHEQNSIPGLTNRLLGRVVDRTFLSIPGSETYFPAGKTVLTGNPVRRELLAGAEIGPGVAGLEAGPPALLILGGSQGAHRVNELVVEALARQREKLPARFRVVHQTGAADAAWVKVRYQELGIQAEVAAFFEDMAAVYQRAGLVVSRAGATTLAELTVMRKPAILIPFPSAADNHQEKNAGYLVEGGAARMLSEQDLTGAELGKEIFQLWGEPGRLAAMAEQAARLASPRATEAILDECLALLEARAA